MKANKIPESRVRGLMRGSGNVPDWIPFIRTMENPGDVAIALRWIRAAGMERRVVESQFPRRLRELNVGTCGYPGPFAQELAKAAEWCGSNRTALTEFAALRDAVDSHLLHGSWREALSTLADIEGRFGQSFWLTRTALAAMVHFAARPVVGRYSAHVLAAVRHKGMLALLVHHLGPLGNKSVNPEDHLGRIRTHMAEIGVPARVAAYMEWWVSGLVPTGDREQAGLLAQAATGTAIDTFEALVAVVSYRIRNSHDSASSWLDPVLATMGIPDLRLQRPLSTPKGGRPISLSAATPLYDALVTGGPVPDPVDGPLVDYWCEVDALARIAAVRESATPPPLAGISRPSRILCGAFAAALNGDGESDAFTQGVRTAFLFGTTTWAKTFMWSVQEELLALGAHEYDPIHPTSTLGASFVPVAPAPYLSIHGQPNWISELEPNESASVLCAAVAAGQLQAEDLAPGHCITPEELALAVSLGFLRLRQWTRAFDSALPLVHSAVRCYRRRGLQIRARALLEAGDHSAAARTMCEYLTVNSGAWFDLPVNEVLRAMSQGEVRGPPVRAQDRVILYSLPPASSYSDFRDEQMNAFDDLLDEYGVVAPSELPEELRRQPWGMYFLTHACGAATIERSLRLPTKTAVLEERIRICNFLEECAPSAVADSARLEAIGLARLLAVTRGVRGLEQAKLTLDVERLNDRVRGAIALDYARYVEGIRRGERPQHSDMVKLAIENHSAPAWDKIDFNSDPVWEVFVGMARKAIRVYLTDPTCGVDACLSMRVRHGAVEGLIHGEFRETQLLTTRRTDGTYAENIEWVQQCAKDLGARADSTSLSLIAGILARLTADVDAIVAKLCSTLLRVRSDAHPYGLVEPKVTDVVLRLIEAGVEPDRHVEMFCDMIFQAVHVALVANLKKVQETVQNYVGSALTDAFADAQTRVTQVFGPHGPVHLTTALTSARTRSGGVARRLAEWFNEPTYLDFEPFDVADCAALALHVGQQRFDLHASITATNPDGVRLHGIFYIPLVDVLLNVLQNVAEHSRVNPPIAEIHIGVTGNLFTITVSNPLEKPPASVEFARVEAIRNAISSSRAEVLGTSEGGSGLAKIANFLTRHPSCLGSTLDFGYVQPGSDFRFQVVLSLKVPENAVVLPSSRHQVAECAS